MERTRRCNGQCELHIQVLSLTWFWYMQELKYFVDAPSKTKSDNQSNDNPAKLELLKGITGYSAPGVLTALMGGSGQSPCCSLLPI